MGSSIRALVGVIGLASLGWPISLAFKWLNAEPLPLFLAASVVCFLIIPLITQRLIVPSLARVSRIENVVFVVCCLFSLTAVVDVLIGLTLEGVTNLQTFYLERGERYLRSSYGSAINLWESVQLTLYVIIAHAIACGRSYRLEALLLVGSVTNSVFVLLPGAAVGPWASQLQASTWLNVPYVFFPVSAFLRLFLSSDGLSSSPLPARSRRLSPHHKLLVGVSLLFWLALVVFRTLASMNGTNAYLKRYVDEIEPHLVDSTRWPMLQAALFAVYCGPVVCAALFVLISGDNIAVAHCRLIGELAVVGIGALFQGQFSYIWSALHPLPAFPVPGFAWSAAPKNLPAFWMVNIAMFAGPLLVAATLLDLPAAWSSSFVRQVWIGSLFAAPKDTLSTNAREAGSRAERREIQAKYGTTATPAPRRSASPRRRAASPARSRRL